MGREVKRVALDFKWPLNKVWEGFVNPHYKQCQDCGGGGETKSSQAAGRIIHLLMIAGDDSRRRKAPHPWLLDFGIKDVGDTFHELSIGLAGREPSFIGHDCIDRYSAVKKIVEAAGLPKDWGICKTCGGGGISPEAKVAYESWVEAEPPNGEGWQMWETVSEGSPISPVFDTAEKLARWLADTGASSFGPMKATYEQWLAMILEGWAPSACGDKNGLQSGVEFIANNPKEKRS